MIEEQQSVGQNRMKRITTILGTALGILAGAAAANAATVAHWTFDSTAGSGLLGQNIPTDTGSTLAGNLVVNGNATAAAYVTPGDSPSDSGTAYLNITPPGTGNSKGGTVNLNLSGITPGNYTLTLSYYAESTGGGAAPTDSWTTGLTPNAGNPAAWTTAWQHFSYSENPINILGTTLTLTDTVGAANKTFAFDDITVTLSPVPEPANVALACFGLGAIGFVVVRRVMKKSQLATA